MTTSPPPDPRDAVAAEEPSWELLLEVLLRRRDHYRQLFIQHEQHTRYLLGIVLGAWALLLYYARHLAVLATLGRGFWFLVLLTACCLAGALLLGLALFRPLLGRRMFGDGGWGKSLESFTTWLGFLGQPEAHFAEKPRDRDALLAFTRGVVLRWMSLPPIPGGLPGRLVRAELWNTWAQWFVTERKAGLLRRATGLLAAGVLFGTVSWVLAAPVIEAGSVLPVPPVALPQVEVAPEPMAEDLPEPTTQTPPNPEPAPDLAPTPAVDTGADGALPAEG